MGKVSGSQKNNGASFEYACAIQLQALLKGKGNLEKDENFYNAFKSWETRSIEEKAELEKVAEFGIKKLGELEPIVKDAKTELRVMIMGSSFGKKGDVRDIVITSNSKDTNDENQWEIGISVKHNHDAFKHSRISPHIDIRKSWANLPPNKLFTDKISSIFESLKAYKGRQWSDIKNKDEVVYGPIMNALKDEILSAQKEHGELFVSSMVRYFIGLKDFHKVIWDKSQSKLTLQSFNFDGTLNKKNIKSRNATSNSKKLNLPKRVYEIWTDEENNEKSKNANLQIDMDSGWCLKMRIHNASSNYEESLKLDIRIIGFSDVYKESFPIDISGKK